MVESSSLFSFMHLMILYIASGQNDAEHNLCIRVIKLSFCFVYIGVEQDWSEALPTSVHKIPEVQSQQVICVGQFACYVLFMPVHTAIIFFASLKNGNLHIVARGFC